MSNTALIIIAAAVVVIALVAVVKALPYRRTKRLRDRFGPEYDRTVDQLGDKHEAEKELQARLEHVHELQIRSLNPEEVNRFALEWETVQAQFVDTPLEAVQNANRLIREVMSTRGYPVDDFDQRVADISVDYPELAAHYRELHDLAKQGETQERDTEKLRQAMLHGRTLFLNLLEHQAQTEANREKEAA